MKINPNMKTLPDPEMQKAFDSPLRSLWARIRAALGTVSIQRRERRLRLCESLSLGEKRLIALVECEDQRFLVAATAENICLLQALGVKPTEKDFSGERS